MNPKKLLALLVVLGCVIAFFQFNKGRIEAEKTTKERAREVLSIPRDDVETVKLERLGEKPVVLVRSAEEGASSVWKITEPVSTQADQSTVENLLVTLTGARKESDTPVSATGERASDYGLDPVELAVTFKSATREETLHVGLLTPSESQAYARKAGDPAIFLLPKSVHTAVNKGLFDLRDKALVSLTNYKVDHLDVRDASARMDLRKETEDLWKIASAQMPMRAERNRITDFLNDLSGAKVAQFVDDATEDLSPYGLVTPATTVEIWEGDQKRTLHFGDFQDWAKTRLYARVEGRPGVLVVESTVLKNAPMDVDKLRSKKFFAARAWNADRVEIESSSPALSLSLTKDASGEWHVAAGTAERALDHVVALKSMADRLDMVALTRALRRMRSRSPNRRDRFLSRARVRWQDRYPPSLDADGTAMRRADGERRRL
ncbi:DUF4340 domain-containing protein [bacterium]|nr:DUF4340 domain-containing protein [bacterium]